MPKSKPTAIEKDKKLTAFEKLGAIVTWKIMWFSLQMMTWIKTGEWVSGKAIVEFDERLTFTSKKNET